MTTRAEKIRYFMMTYLAHIIIQYDNEDIRTIRTSDFHQIHDHRDPTHAQEHV